jgi:hypothetical protein
MKNGYLIELTREQILERLEQGAQRRRGVSARELLQAYIAGRLEDPGAVADLLMLADLLPEDDPLLVPA